MEIKRTDKKLYLKLEKGDDVPTCCICGELIIKDGYFFKRPEPIKNFFWCSRECIVKTNNDTLNPYSNTFNNTVEIDRIEVMGGK